MNEKKQNILAIEYHIQRGLTFSWNLRGLSSKDVYFRHLFLFASSQQALLEDTLCNICAKIKIGDFLALFHKKKDQTYEKLHWSQRTSLNFDKVSLKGIEKFATNELISLLPAIAKETEEFSNPTLLNIFLEDTADLPKYKQVIQKLRIEGFFLYHVNFFGQFACHDISPATGFNQINTNEDTLPQVARIYRSLACETAAHRVKVELSCPNIQLAPRRDCLWESVDFGRMKRYYYGPSIHYEQDCINFLDESASRAGTNVPMLVKLEVTLFSGKVLVAEKAFTLTTENMRLYQMTRCDSTPPRSTYEFSKNVRSKTQPFCSSSALALTKIINAM